MPTNQWAGLDSPATSYSIHSANAMSCASNVTGIADLKNNLYVPPLNYRRRPCTPTSSEDKSGLVNLVVWRSIY